MSAQCFLLNVNRVMTQDRNAVNNETKPPVQKEKMMSYEEKSVGSTPFFKCEACPYMALAVDDIKFHLFTVHPELAKSNGLADNVRIPCPGCTSIFDAEETLRTHLRSHHKMGIKDIKKMIKSLVQIALKDAKLKKEDNKCDPPPTLPIRQDIADVKIPQLIEIVPDAVNATNESLPKGVTFISVDELHKMSTPNFEKVDPKEIIQEASINIVYTNDVSTQYLKVSDVGPSNNTCNVIQVPNVPPDLISSIKPRVMPADKSIQSTQITIDGTDVVSHTPSIQVTKAVENRNSKTEVEKKLGEPCDVVGCNIHLKNSDNLKYHKKCHQNGKLQCPECNRLFLGVESLHSHLWKAHSVDMELPTCEICGFKTYKKHRLYNIHMRCHGKLKHYTCTICGKAFKNTNQLSKHKTIHKKDTAKVQCSLCKLEFNNKRKLKVHVATIHEKLKPFKCCYCDYTAARNDELKLHLRSHTGDKPYTCDQCNYRSSDHNSMRRHKKTHSLENIYKCKYCPYTAIQSNLFASHMISKHPNIPDVHRCPYCTYKSINKEKYVSHLATHTDKEGIQLLIEMAQGVKSNKPSWTIPIDTVTTPTKDSNIQASEPNNESNLKTVNTIPIEVYDCDSLSETLPQEYPKNYCTSSEVQQPTFNNKMLHTDLNKDDNNPECLISENSNESMLLHQYKKSQLPMQIPYDNNQTNLHSYLNPTVSMEQNLLQNTNVNSLTSNHCVIGSNLSNNIMSNLPIRLPPVPQISVRNNITLKPADKISLPVTKVTGPIIKPTQILPVPSSSNSPVNTPHEIEGAPRKKAKISVKSNLILKGPDQENMFHSQQKMAFKRLEDNERFRLGPVTFNNLITTQLLQLQPQPALSESPSDIMPYPQETMMSDTVTTPVDNELNDNSQIFPFNQQMNVNSMTMLPPPQKIQTNDPSYIKIETTIKQNTQSPSLERMCNANLLNNQAITREYKASPPLEDIHKDMSEIKNEVKSDAFYNIGLNNTANNPSIIDQYLMDNIMGEQYTGHMDLSTVVLPEISDDQQNDVIEIDDNSDDTKLLPRFDMNFPMESLYLMHNDFHFLDNDIPTNNVTSEVLVPVNEMNRIVNEVPIINQKESLDLGPSEGACNTSDFPNFIQGKKDPMMNTSVRPSTNKINVKNIELMKN